jgi:UDP-N-acetyl-2-amino-2-deoxyglucuronate dehydrogenase
MNLTQAGLDRSRAKLRYAFVGGAAAIVEAHIESVRDLPVEIVGMSDVDAARGRSQAAKADCPFFIDHRELLRELRPDAVVICTPHPFHAEHSCDCLLAGSHVLVEKPMAVEVTEADGMIAAAENSGRLLGVNFQERFRATVEYARDFIGRGELGTLLRVLSIEPCMRTAAYYRSAPWRGTWRGEGGGVLMNQAPHTLDILCHLVGMPALVWGMTRTRAHAIETEDSAQAMLEYPNGALGYITASTAESGTDRRLEIIGDRASLKLVQDELTIVRFDPPLRDHIALSAEFFGQPRTRADVVDLPRAPEPRHHAAHRDFYEAIRAHRPPWCDGRSGLMSLELANAITLSSFTERPVTFPLDRSAYAQLLAELRAGRRTPALPIAR